jgi:3-(3-hydroxy-phenyl)propionate hydroxylase
MLSTYTYPKFEARRAPELDGASPAQYPLVIVGAGPVGLACAIDCAQRGLPVLLLDDDDTVSIGSRGLCYAKRTLEVLDRLGCGDAVVQRGVTWNTGRTFHRDTEVFSFELLPEAGHERPGMVNLQQYHLEEALVRRAQALPGIDLRWKSRVTALAVAADHVLIEVDSAHGKYTLRAGWVVAADGARSPLRRMLGLDVEGQVFRDRFLIADVVMKAQLFPAGAAERWFWFDPPFHPGQSVLLHREADDVWRIDFQLGWDADPELEKQPERVKPRIRAMLEARMAMATGETAAVPEFELEWVSVYTFQCRRMPQLRQGRVLFAGDAAHQVSPFGARGANSGIQDADNLAWKLALVIGGQAPVALLDSYAAERGSAADDNLLNSTRATDFITPKSQVSHDFRDAVLGLAREHAFARMLVNSGRLSVPTALLDSPLNTSDGEHFDTPLAPGMPLPDAPVRVAGRPAWLLRELGRGFELLLFADQAGDVDAPTRAALRALDQGPLAVRTLLVVAQPPQPGASPEGLTVLHDHEGLAARRCGALPGTALLLRPDQHLAARWRDLRPAAVRSALARATCNLHGSTT